MIKVKKLIFFFASQYFVKEMENMFYSCFYRVIEVKVWENSKKVCISCSPKLLLVFL